jgi:hypothetical protein
LAGAALGFCGASITVLYESFVVNNLYERFLFFLAKTLDGRNYYESGDSASYALLLFKLAFSALGACVVFHRELIIIAKLVIYGKGIDDNKTIDNIDKKSS